MSLSNSIRKGYKFEHTVSTYFKRKGYTVKPTRKSRDYGIDIIISKRGIHTGIECKAFKRGQLVGRPIIQKFDSALAHNPYGKPLEYGIVVTTSDYTSDAIEAVKRINADYRYNRLRLINGAEFKRMTAVNTWQNSLVFKLVGLALLYIFIKCCLLNNI